MIVNLPALRARMAAHGVSNRKLAAAVGYASHAYVNRIVSGDVTTVTPEKADAIARHLDVDVADLFDPIPEEASA